VQRRTMRKRSTIPGVIVAGLLSATAAAADPYNPGERAITGGLLGAGTGAVIGAIAGGGHGAGIGAAVGGGLGAVAGAATTPARPPRHAYRRHYYNAYRPY
jgi:predicted lipid-binding transport protein (Tim44 family)